MQLFRHMQLSWELFSMDLDLQFQRKNTLFSHKRTNHTAKRQGYELCKMTPGPCPHTASCLAQRVPFGSLSLGSKFFFFNSSFFCLFIPPNRPSFVLPPPPAATIVLLVALLCVVAAWRCVGGQLSLCDLVHHWVLTLCFCNCLRC